MATLNYTGNATELFSDAVNGPILGAKGLGSGFLSCLSISDGTELRPEDIAFTQVDGLIYRIRTLKTTNSLYLKVATIDVINPTFKQDDHVFEVGDKYVAEPYALSGNVVVASDNNSKDYPIEEFAYKKEVLFTKGGEDVTGQACSFSDFDAHDTYVYWKRTLKDYAWNAHILEDGHPVRLKAYLSLDLSDVAKNVVLNGDETELDLNGLRVSVASGKESLEIFQFDTYVNPSFDATQEATYNVAVYGYFAGATYSSSFLVYARPNRIEGITPNGKDVGRYYDTNPEWITPFAKPSFSFSATKADGSEETVLATDERIKYYTDKDCMHEIQEGQILPKCDSVYIRFDGRVTSFYDVVASKDLITSIKITEPASVCLGRKLNEYSFDVSIERASGKTEEHWKDFTIVDSNSYLVEPGAKVAVTLIDNEHKTELTDEIALVSPALDAVEISSYGGIDTSINNGKDAFDVTDAKLTAYFKDGDKRISYAKELSYNDGFSVRANDSEFTPFDGSAAINLSMLTGKKNVIVTFTASNPFNAGNTLELELPVSVVAITNIAYIKEGDKIKGYNHSYKTTYNVGETFLGNDDESNVRIGYVDADGNVQETKILLNTASNLLNINPLPNSKVSERGTFEVRIASVYDSTKSLSYSFTAKNAVRYVENTKKLTLKPYKLPQYHAYRAHGKSVELFKGDYILVEKSALVKNGNQVTLNGNLSVSHESNNGIKIYGYLKNVGDKGASGIVVLFDDYITPVSGDSNAIVKFPCYDPESSDFVNKCRFAVRFGHNNSLNRLFLAGNPYKPNYDIHSAETDWQYTLTEDESKVRSTEGDYSYIPDEGMMKYGESENAIVGYDIVSDSKLLVLKNKAGGERTVYFRSPTSVTMLDSSGKAATDIGGNALYQEEYANAMSNSPTAGISPWTIGNFNGDTLFASDENSIVGLDLVGQIGNSQRQANSRSLFIDPLLKGVDFSKAILKTAGSYCFLSTEEALYVAHKDALGEDRQYEWWPCEPLNATLMFEGFDGTVYFGREDGSFFRLKKGQYSDTERYFFNRDAKDLAIVKMENGGITIPLDIAKEIDATWKLRQNKSSDIRKNLFNRLVTIGEGFGLRVNGDYLEIPAEQDFAHLQSVLVASRTYYFCGGKTMVACGENIRALMNAYAEIKLKPLEGYFDGAYVRFEAYNGKNRIMFSQEGYGIEQLGLADALDRELSIASIDGGFVAMKDCELVSMPGQDLTEIDVELTKYSPIVSEFITAPFLIDTLNYMKHIYKIDFINATKEPSDLDVAQIAVNNGSTIKADFVNLNMRMVPFPSGSPEFDLNQFDFSATTFSRNIAPKTYSLPRFFSKKRYFSLALRSNKDKNSVLPGIEITYSYVRLAKGSE